MSARSNRLCTVSTLSAAALVAAVISTSTDGYTVVHTDVATRNDVVMLTASIDTASNAVGISESSLYFMTQSNLNTAMQELQTMGVTQVRVLLPWEAMESTAGTYNWTQSDQLLNTAAKYGIAVDADVTSTPSWASKYSAGGLVPDAAPNSSAYAAYAAFVGAVASRYTSKISSIEVWNEPNGNTGWYPVPDAAGYTTLLKAAYAAIKAADPNITVVGGVLGAGITIGTWTVNPVTFLQQMYADGAAGYFDALSFHPYNSSEFSAGTTFANSAIKQLQALRALMNSNGDAAKLIWATEYGEPSSEKGGQAQQAAYIQDFLNTWSKQTGVGPTFLYSLLDDSEGDNLGLFTDGWTAKSAVAVVEAWIAAHPESTTATPPAAAGGTTSTVSQALSTAVANIASAVQKIAAGIVTALANLAKSLAAGMASAASSLTHAAAAVAAAFAPKPASSPANAKSATSTGAPQASSTAAATGVTQTVVAVQVAATSAASQHAASTRAVSGAAVSTGSAVAPSGSGKSTIQNKKSTRSHKNSESTAATPQNAKQPVQANPGSPVAHRRGSH